MRCIGYQSAFTVKDGAGKVESFFDVDGMTDMLQSGAHLLGNGHEDVVEKFQ